MARSLTVVVISVLAATATAQSTMDECITNPSKSECAPYHYSYAESDLALLCSVHSMTACSLQTSCEANEMKEPDCNPIALLGHICLLDGMGSMNGCQNMTQLCVAQSSVKECNDAKSLTNLPTTSQVSTEVKKICESHKMSACDECGQFFNMCPDTLATYSDLCVTMPEMSACSTYHSFCSSYASWEDFCPEKASPPSTDCYSNPKNPECANLSYQWSSEDVNSLCRDMPAMSGCSLRSTCAEIGDDDKTHSNREDVCDDWAILLHICLVDGMAGMKGCKNASALCVQGSSVKA